VNTPIDWAVKKVREYGEALRREKKKVMKELEKNKKSGP
jgi:hypothetical protein